MGDKDDPQGASTKDKTLRTFGRALSFFGSGAKAFLTHPMKAARRARPRSNPNSQIQNAQPNIAQIADTHTAVTLHPFEVMRNEFAEGFQNTQQILSGHLQDSADFVRRTLALPNSGSAGFLRASCFPPKIQKSSQGSRVKAEDMQELICSGSRSLLRIKLYDFAVYLDRKDVQQSSAKREISKNKSEELDERAKQNVAKQIRDSTDIEMSLLVRASRNLPILLLSKEYERILKRRLRVVGGNQNDPALSRMMDTFREEILPPEIKQGGSVKKGTVLIFSRDHTGNISAKANNHDLISVNSQKLAQAVFDIYLGDQVVCQNARTDGADSFLKLLETSSYTPPQSGLVCSESVCKIGRV